MKLVYVKYQDDDSIDGFVIIHDDKIAKINGLVLYTDCRGIINTLKHKIFVFDLMTEYQLETINKNEIVCEFNFLDNLEYKFAEYLI